MKNQKDFICLIACILIFILVYGTFAQDWPQWRGANRDGKVAGFTAPQKWPDTLLQKWQVAVGLGDASPVLAGNMLYVFARQDSNEVIICLNASSGKELWQSKYTALKATGPPGTHPGPRSTPTVADGKVVTLGIGGVLSCFDANNGRLLWRNEDYTKELPQFYTAMSPIVVDGKCIAHLGGTDNGVIIAFDLNTGAPIWKWAGDGPTYSSPVLMKAANTLQVVVHTEKNLIGLNLKDGKLLWQKPTPVQRRFYNSATAIIDGQTVYYTGQGEGTKALIIKKEGNGFVANELWRNEELGTSYNTPILKNGFLYGLSDKGKLFCMNAINGQIAWVDTTRYKNFGSTVDGGSVILTVTSDSKLIVFNATEKKFTELAKIKVADTPIYAHPLIVGKKIYIKDEKNLTLWLME